MECNSNHNKFLDCNSRIDITHASNVGIGGSIAVICRIQGEMVNACQSEAIVRRPGSGICGAIGACPAESFGVTYPANLFRVPVGTVFQPVRSVGGWLPPTSHRDRE